LPKVSKKMTFKDTRILVLSHGAGEFIEKPECNSVTIKEMPTRLYADVDSYISVIWASMGKVDFIIIEDAEDVLLELLELDLEYTTIYPQNSLKLGELHDSFDRRGHIVVLPDYCSVATYVYAR